MLTPTHTTRIQTGVTMELYPVAVEIAHEYQEGENRDWVVIRFEHPIVPNFIATRIVHRDSLTPIGEP